MESRSFHARFADGRRDESTLRRWLRRGLGPALAAALVAVPLATPGAAQNSDLKARYNMGDPVPADNVASTPDAYLGKKVFVEGYVDDVYGPRLFELEKAPQHDRMGTTSHAHDLLIYMPATVSFAGVGKDKKIRVVGVLQEGLTAPAAEIGSHDLAHRAVVVAEAVEVM